MLSMAFPHVLLRFSNGIVNNFIVSFPLPLVYAQDVGRKPDRDARKTAESGFGAAPDPSTQFSLFRLYIFEHPTFHSAQDDEMGRTFTLHSSLDSEVDLHASYLENAILVPSP